MNVLCHSGMLSAAWSLYYSREPLGRGVKAWNVHYFPTGSRAWKSTIAPRPDLSITRKVGLLLKMIQIQRTLLMDDAENEKHHSTLLLTFVLYLKTFYLSYVILLHCTKFHNTLQKYWKAFLKQQCTNAICLESSAFHITKYSQVVDFTGGHSKVLPL